MLRHFLFAFCMCFVYNDNGDGMKKNGFTLMEVLAVLIILSIMVVIAIPMVNTAIKNSKDKSYLRQMEGIVDSAKIWASEHIFELPDEEDETLTLTLTELIQGGYVDQNIKNPKTGEAFTDVSVKITYKDNILVYTIYDAYGIVNFD